jgi:hypothetical protein
MALRKLELEGLEADLAAVDDLLRSSSEEEDPIGYRQFASRKEELSALIEKIAKSENPLASVALFFSGDPVFGSRGVEAEFASKVVASFQDIVAKRMASSEVGNLGRRGPVPLKPSSDLMITDVARGSVGFILEEAGRQDSFTDTSLKLTVDQVVDLLADVGSEDEDMFEKAAETLDSRQLTALQALYSTLDEARASVRLVEDDKERIIDSASVGRARSRIEAMQIDERESDNVTGKLLGLLPGHRKFELQLSETGETIYGSVSPEVSKKHLERLGDVEGKIWRTRMRIREIKRRNRHPKVTYTLLGLLEEIKS